MSFLRQVLILSFTAFGGPAGHLIAFIKVFVDQEKLFSKDEILHLHSFCSILPGASSTQLICLIAYIRGGYLLSILSFLIWITPVSISMFLIATFLSNNDYFSNSQTLFLFFEPMIISFTITAAYKLRHSHCETKKDALLLLINTLLLLLFFKHPFILPFTFILNGFISYKLRVNQSLKHPFTSTFKFPINRPIIFLFIVLLIGSGFMSEYSRKLETTNRYIYNIVEHNLRHGTIVYGGGDVLVPIMYEQYVSRPSASIIRRRNPDVLSLTNDQLLVGAGIIRLMPGPVFSLVSYTTPLLVKDYNFSRKSFTTIIATLAIFLPGVFIILFLYPLWRHISLNTTFALFLKGINLTVLSILCASSIYFIGDMYLQSTNISQLTFQSISIFLFFFLINKYEINHGLVALICLFLGGVTHFL